MRTCHSCTAAIDEYYLDKDLESLRDLTVDDFNLCSACVTVVSDACVECDGGVYVPRGDDDVPDRCPACRADRIARTGTDPGWNRNSRSQST